MNEQPLEWFRRACGLSAPLVLECEDPSSSVLACVERSFDLPFILVGRHPGSDLFLDNRQVSRRHAFLQAVAGRVFVIDLQSRTKLYWEGEESPQSEGWFEPDRYIQVGPYRVRRAGCGAGGNQNRVPATVSAFLNEERLEAGAMPRASLELPIRAGGGPALWPVEGEMAVVGRSERCQLVLSDDSISRFHAVLVPTRLGLWVVDLLGRDGVHVNGERVRWAWLAERDALRVGRFTFVLRYETPPRRITRDDVPLAAGARPDETPGTALAVRAGHSDNGQRALVARPKVGSSLARPAVASPIAPASAALVPSSEAFWAPPVSYAPNPMAMWQQHMQMTESFHNDMVLMVQMFLAMHREHLASVRHELEMVQKLTSELTTLQSKAAQPARTANSCDSVNVDRPALKRQPRQSVQRQRPDEKAESGRSERAAKFPEPDSPRSAGRSTASGAEVPTSKGPTPPPPDTSRAVEEEDVHALLTQRIAQLQRERQGYWQRILRTING
jgi:pSer/pThr/pTyr-binding forkhead associated (FHA) protein